MGSVLDCARQDNGPIVADVGWPTLTGHRGLLRQRLKAEFAQLKDKMGAGEDKAALKAMLQGDPTLKLVYTAYERLILNGSDPSADDLRIVAMAWEKEILEFKEPKHRRQRNILTACFWHMQVIAFSIGHVHQQLHLQNSIEAVNKLNNLLLRTAATNAAMHIRKQGSGTALPPLPTDASYVDDGDSLNVMRK